MHGIMQRVKVQRSESQVSRRWSSLWDLPRAVPVPCTEMATTERADASAAASVLLQSAESG